MPEAGLSGRSLAAGEKITIDLAADRDRITIGDLVTLTLTVKSPGIAMVKEPDLSAFLQDFELRNAKKPLVQEKEGEKTSIFQYEITTFTTGKKTLEPPGSPVQADLRRERLEKGRHPGY